MADDMDGGSVDSLESSLTEMDWLGRLNIEGGGLRGLIAGSGSAATTRKPVVDDDQTNVPMRVNNKPSFSYTNLITAAITSSATRKMALSDIYQWISDRFPYYRHAAPGWKVTFPRFHGITRLGDSAAIPRYAQWCSG